MSKWDKIYRKDGLDYVSDLQYWPKLIDLFKKNKMSKILDIGCGSGNHLLSLAKQGFKVYGLDFSKEAITLAGDRFVKAGLNAELQVGSMHDPLPFSDNFFDGIISLRTLNHGDYDKINNTIREIRRILKPGGMVFITSLMIPGSKKRSGKTTLNAMPVRIVKPRTYIPLAGKEKGIMHYLFNKEILLNLFKQWKIEKFWIEYGEKKWERYYCLLARNSSNHRFKAE
jgi:ubiquinone/menaquinone biosynthesis C-methylase UbiE